MTDLQAVVDAADQQGQGDREIEAQLNRRLDEGSGTRHGGWQGSSSIFSRREAVITPATEVAIPTRSRGRTATTSAVSSGAPGIPTPSARAIC